MKLLPGRTTADTTAGQERARLVVGVLSAVLVVAFVIVCVRVDDGRGSSPALVRATGVQREHRGAIDTMTVTVKNTGDVTAEQVLVRATVADDDAVDHEIDFLAPDAEDEVSYVVPAGTPRRDVHIAVLAWTSSE